jgi:outer membrane protein TolC
MYLLIHGAKVLSNFVASLTFTRMKSFYSALQFFGACFWPFFAFFLSAPIHPLCSQRSPVLDAYISEGLANNLSVLKSELDVERSRTLLAQARASARPSVEFNASYILAAGGRSLDFPVGDLLNPVYSTLNFLTQSSLFPQIENTKVRFIPNNFQETKFNFAYPIYNTDLKYLKTIRESEVAGRISLRDAREVSLAGEISQAYIQYLQTLELRKIWLRSKNVLLELKRFNQSLVRNNVATSDVVSTAEYELSKVENELFHTSSLENSARSYFNYLIGADLLRPVTADTSLLNTPVQAYSLDELIQNAPERRSELKALESFSTAAMADVKRNEANQKLPDVYIGGSAGFQGFGYDFTNDQAYVLTQVGLSYPIYNGGLNRSKSQESRLNARMADAELRQVAEQVKLDIIASFNAFEAARFSLLSAQKNVEAAEAIFRIVNNKYRAGQALLLEFLDAKNRVDTALQQEIIARADLLIRQAALRKSAGLQ